MAEIKTKVTDDDVQAFINAVANEQKKKDGLELLEIFTRLTGEQPKLWSNSIIGFGQYHYKSEKSRQEGDWMLTGFSPRKQALTLYLMLGHSNYSDLLKRLGKHKTGMGCVYINKLDDVDRGVLEELIQKSYTHMKQENA
ncbi:MAG TPA: DUF1801 domain-containing protein [Candidatus Saccharimonadales bacterium]|nr:DUF1801 domain-containing protein [Candidatus Saccharimonadales bacterium]